jgi:hypothetical protein
MHPHGPRVLLGRMAQVSRLLSGLETTVFDAAAVIIVIQRRRGLFNRGMGQEHVLPPGPSSRPAIGARPPH